MRGQFRVALRVAALAWQEIDPERIFIRVAHNIQEDDMQAGIEALADDDLSAARLRRYQRRWKELLSRELEVGYSARRLYEALNDQQISSLVRQAGASGVRYDLVNAPDTSFDWHSRVILKSVSHKDLRPLITSFGPIVTGLLLRLIRPGS